MSFIILDKPAGITSFDACDIVRRKLQASKAGHAGTLDPMVTGVLLIALNSSTKLMPLLERLDKTYEGTAHLHNDVSLVKLKTVMKKFQGKIKQIPPRKSRVKRVEREREIFEFNILKKTKRDFSFKVSCEAGTYIRKLINDLGKNLGGAHMTSLRRTKQGPFTVKQTVRLEKINRKNLVADKKIISKLKIPIIKVDEKTASKLKFGQFLFAREIKFKNKFDKDAILPVFFNKKVIALARVLYSSKEIRKIKGYVLKPERII